MFSKLKQIRDLRSQAKKIQGALSDEKVTIDAEGGRVHLVMNGNQEIISLDIDPTLLKPEEKSRLESGLKDALTSANKRVQQIMAKKVKDMGGLPNL